MDEKTKNKIYRIIMIIILLIEFGNNIALIVIFLKIKYEFTKIGKNIIKEMKEKSEYSSYIFHTKEKLENRIFLNQTNFIIFLNIFCLYKKLLKFFLYWYFYG